MYTNIDKNFKKIDECFVITIKYDIIIMGGRSE